MASLKSFRTQVFNKFLGVLFACVLTHSSMVGQAGGGAGIPPLPECKHSDRDCDVYLKAKNDASAAYVAADQQLKQADALDAQANDEDRQAQSDRISAAHADDKAINSERWRRECQANADNAVPGSASQAGWQGLANQAAADKTADLAMKDGYLKSAQQHEANAEQLRQQAKELRQTATAAKAAAEAAYYAASALYQKCMRLPPCPEHTGVPIGGNATGGDAYAFGKEANAPTYDVPVPSYLTVLTIHSDSGSDETVVYNDPLTAYPIYDPETGRLRGRGVSDTLPGEAGWWGMDPKTGKLNWHRHQNRPPISTLPKGEWKETKQGYRFIPDEGSGGTPPARKQTGQVERAPNQQGDEDVRLRQKGAKLKDERRTGPVGARAR